YAQTANLGATGCAAGTGLMISGFEQIPARARALSRVLESKFQSPLHRSVPRGYGHKPESLRDVQIQAGLSPPFQVEQVIGLPPEIKPHRFPQPKSSHHGNVLRIQRERADIAV